MSVSKSVIVKKFGGYDALIVKDFPLSELGELIEVKMEYGGMNFGDLFTVKGLTANKPPFVLGIEGAGRITTVGNNSTNLKVGQRVICFSLNGGLFRETVRVPPESCFPIPDYIDTQTAAAIFVNYLTAYFAVFHCASLKPNEDILIESCAGGVGWAATQFAKTVEGVKVFGTTSSWKEYDVKENGVDIVIRREDFSEQLQKHTFDVIISNQSGEMVQRFQDRLNQMGRLVLLGASNIITGKNKLSTFDLLKLWWQTKNIKPSDLLLTNRTVSGHHLGILLLYNPEKVKTALNNIFDMIKKGTIKPRIHSVCSMDEIVEASKLLADRKNIGKVLIKIG